MSIQVMQRHGTRGSAEETDSDPAERMGTDREHETRDVRAEQLAGLAWPGAWAASICFHCPRRYMCEAVSDAPPSLIGHMGFGFPSYCPRGEFPRV
jgi:hypothetical protein